MKSFKKLFVLAVTFFLVSILSAQAQGTRTPPFQIDFSQDARIGAVFQVRAGTQIEVPVVHDGSIISGLLNTAANIDVEIGDDTSPNFRVTDVRGGLIPSFVLNYTANAPSGTVETAELIINLKGPLGITLLSTIATATMEVLQ